MSATSSRSASSPPGEPRRVLVVLTSVARRSSPGRGPVRWSPWPAWGRGERVDARAVCSRSHRAHGRDGAPDQWCATVHRQHDLVWHWGHQAGCGHRVALADGINPVSYVSSSPSDLTTFTWRSSATTGSRRARCCSATCSAPSPVASSSRVASKRALIITLGCGSCSSETPGTRAARSTPPSLGRIRDGSSRSTSARSGATRAMVRCRRSRTPEPRTCPRAPGQHRRVHRYAVALGLL